MTGQDVVLSCIGHVHKTKRELLMLRFTTITMYTDHIKPLIAAMSAAKVKRLINITSWGTSGKCDDVLMRFSLSICFVGGARRGKRNGMGVVI